MNTSVWPLWLRPKKLIYKNYISVALAHIPAHALPHHSDFSSLTVLPINAKCWLWKERLLSIKMNWNKQCVLIVCEWLNLLSHYVKKMQPLNQIIEVMRYPLMCL